MTQDRDVLDHIEQMKTDLRTMRMRVLCDVDDDSMVPIAGNCLWKALSFLELASRELEAASLWIVEKRSRDRS
jgi:hypothetical protein